MSQVKVPLSYAPKRSFIDRIAQMNQGEDAERQIAINCLGCLLKSYQWNMILRDSYPKRIQGFNH